MPGAQAMGEELWFASQNDTEAVRRLLRRGAPPTFSAQARAAALAAAHLASAGCGQGGCLTSHPPWRAPQGKLTALHVAAANGSADCLALLAAAGGDVTARCAVRPQRPSRAHALTDQTPHLALLRATTAVRWRDARDGGGRAFLGAARCASPGC